MNKLTDYIGKIVQIYPKDTYYKFGILLEVSSYGFLFEITSAEKASDYKKGDHVFFSISSQLSFKALD